MANPADVSKWRGAIVVKEKVQRIEESLATQAEQARNAEIAEALSMLKSFLSSDDWEVGKQLLIAADTVIEFGSLKEGNLYLGKDGFYFSRFAAATPNPEVNEELVEKLVKVLGWGKSGEIALRIVPHIVGKLNEIADQLTLLNEAALEKLSQAAPEAATE